MFNKSSKENFTATRHTLSEDWKDMMKKIDWMSAPTMAEYANGLVSGKSLNDGGHWALYALEKFVEPLFKHKNNKIFKGKPLTMLSLACGSAHIEESLIKEFKWPISKIHGLEYDSELRRRATETFSKYPNVKSTFDFFDFNNPSDLSEKFDIVFCCHSIHHATDLEKFLPSLNGYLKDDGLIIGIDFFGPTRFQIEFETQSIIKELFEILPESLRRDLRDPKGKVFKEFEFDTIKKVRDADISESVRSSDLRTLLFSNFPVIEIKPMGGTILRWLLQYRAGNFQPNNPDHVAIVRLLQVIERELIFSNKIRSDDLFFVLRKSSRF